MSIAASEGELELLERKIWQRCFSGGSGCQTAMLSRAAERVRLEWRKPPCPEPSRLDDWFLWLACAGSQCSAPGASLPEVHDELIGRGRHLLLPETNLLTPPTSQPLVVQLGSIRGSPWWSGQVRCKCVLYCLHPAGQTVPPLPDL